MSVFKSSSSSKQSMFSGESGTLDSILRVFSIASSMRTIHRGFFLGSAPTFLAKSPPTLSKIAQSKSRAPRFLSLLWQIILVLPQIKLAIVTVVLLWPKSTKATLLSSFASRSFFLKKPYYSAIAVLSLIRRRHFIPAISAASSRAYRSTLLRQLGTEITIDFALIYAFS